MNTKNRKIWIYGIIIVGLIICVFLFFMPDKGRLRDSSLPRTLVLSVYEIADGLPGQIRGQIVKKSRYWVSYNEEHEQANWTAYILTGEMVSDGNATRTDDFRTDTSVVTGSAELVDYKGSGYDRGHLVPAGDMNLSRQIMSESFYMSNMSPQSPGFNRGIWIKLESEVRKWALQNDSIYVITGPVLSSVEHSIGENEVGVPQYFYKVIVDISHPTYKAIAFVMKNESSRAEIFDFAVTVDSVENLINYDFFASQDPEFMEYIESRIDVIEWE